MTLRSLSEIAGRDEVVAARRERDGSYTITGEPMDALEFVALAAYLELVQADGLLGCDEYRYAIRLSNGAYYLVR